MVRVLIVDDDPWLRAGRRAVLDADDGVEVVDAVDHRTALETLGPDAWVGLDVVVVDAHDPTAAFDHFAGVAVAEQARRAAPALRIVVLSGHVYNDVLRVRMAEAGADEFHAHADIDTPDALVDLVLGRRPPATAAGADVRDARQRLGLATDSRVNEAVRWAEENLEASVFDAPTLEGSGLSRRRTITARTRLAGLMGLDPQPSSAAPRSIPTWREVVAVIERARGRERRRT